MGNLPPTVPVVSKKLSAIRAFLENGFCLIPLRGKIPTIKNWVETAPGQYGEKELAESNYGVRLGASDLVVDVDPRSFVAGDQPLARLISVIGPVKTFTVRTGGGGLHLYFRKPADLIVPNTLKEFPGIEFKSFGRQVVAPFSIHPDSGKQYEIASPIKINEITDAPAALLALFSKTSPVAFSDVGTGTFVNDAATQGRYLAYLTDVAEVSIEGKAGDNNAFKVACHGRDLGLPPATTLDLMLSAWNGRCQPPWEEEELKAKVLNAYKFAKGAVGSAHPSAAFEAVAPRPEKKEEPLAWTTTGPNKKITKCFQNLLNYLRLPAGGLFKIFAYNELSGRVEFVSPAPWHNGRMPGFVGVGDRDLKLLKGYLAVRHGFEANLQDIESAITNVADAARFHPVREYLEGLKWDGKPRLNTWLKDYLGAVDGGYPEYLAAVSRKVLCAAVMRIMKPGIEFHHVLVLEGPQDMGKSSTCKILGGPWASDAPVDPHSRDTVDAMQGRWIIEIAEMETGRKTEEDALKAFLTRSTDRVRLAYGRSTGEYPRQSIFIASKNPGPDGTYLKDTTGNRRWWPVRCEPRWAMGQIDFKGLIAARNQLFAEAVHIVKTSPGEKLSMDTPILKEQAKAVAGARHAAHQWTESIARWIAYLDEKPETRRDFLTSREVYIEALQGTDVRLKHYDMTSIAGILRTMGWTQTSKRIGGAVLWGWKRDDKALDKLLSEL